MKNLVSKIAGAAVLGAALLGSGCELPSSGRELKQKEYTNSNGGTIYSGKELSMNLGVRQYDIKMEKKTIPVHPDDAGFLHGTTDVNASGKYLDVPVAFKTKGLVGVEKVAFTGGLELRLNTGHPSERDSKTYMYDYKQQSSDPRPDSEGSFVFDKIDPYWGTVVPTIGVKLFPCEKYQVDLEYGTPFTSATRTWGNHRYAEEDPTGSKTSSAFGQRVSGEFGYFFDKTSGVSVGYAREWTKFEGIGEMNSNIFFLSFKIRF